jgi:hypothetical protein
MHPLRYGFAAGCAAWLCLALSQLLSRLGLRPGLGFAPPNRVEGDKNEG